MKSTEQLLEQLALEYYTNLVRAKRRAAKRLKQQELDDYLETLSESQPAGPLPPRPRSASQQAEFY